MKPTKWTTRLAVCLALAPAAAATSGCLLIAVGAAGAAGAGTVAYVRGELDAALDSPYEAVVGSANDALSQLQFAKVSESKDAFTADLLARTADDTKIELHIVRKADRLTDVKIRIGVFGDEAKSRAILDQIKTNLH
jgi:hypothetical protein